MSPVPPVHPHSLPPFLRLPRGMPPGGPRSPRFGPPRSPFRPGMIRGPPGSRPPFPFRGPHPFRGRSPSPTSSAAGSRKSSFDGPLGRPNMFEKVPPRRPSNSLPPLGENTFKYGDIPVTSSTSSSSVYTSVAQQPEHDHNNRGSISSGHHLLGMEEEVLDSYEMQSGILPPPMPSRDFSSRHDEAVTGYDISPTASIGSLENTDKQLLQAATTQHNDSLSNWVNKAKKAPCYDNNLYLNLT